ncbi:MAG: hypothetical protein PHC41_09025 [Lachnospiraceae bacterium]|nr:hypothetical protein [Lachnospiraceae bacterium]MDD3616351.1 hypothetical protein [Lachnospiraceae bacterium]
MKEAQKNGGSDSMKVFLKIVAVVAVIISGILGIMAFLDRREA